MGKSALISKTPAVTAAAYSTGNVVGGPLEFPLALDSEFSGVLHSATLKTKIVPTGCSFDLWLFKGTSSSPFAGTYADKAAPVWSDSDLANLLGVVNFPQYRTFGDFAVFDATGIGKVVTSGYTSLWGVLIVTGTPTFASVTDVIIDLGVLKD